MQEYKTPTPCFSPSQHMCSRILPKEARSPWSRANSSKKENPTYPSTRDPCRDFVVRIHRLPWAYVAPVRCRSVPRRRPVPPLAASTFAARSLPPVVRAAPQPHRASPDNRRGGPGPCCERLLGWVSWRRPAAAAFVQVQVTAAWCLVCRMAMARCVRAPSPAREQPLSAHTVSSGNGRCTPSPRRTDCVGRCCARAERRRVCR